MVGTQTHEPNGRTGVGAGLRWAIVVLGLGGLASACGGAGTRESTLPRRKIDMEEVRIVARRGPNGDYAFESYDAAQLFERGTALLNQRRCADAVLYYDRIAQEFGSSRYLSPALYNAGLCLADMGRLQASADRFSALIERVPTSPDVRHASFQLADLSVRLEHYPVTLSVADRLLTEEGLSAEERVEAMARRAQALFGLGKLDEAEAQARSTLTYYRTRKQDDPIRDEYFAAAANFVLAETVRARAQALSFPKTSVEEQRAVLVRRAELLLQAQREYFNTIRLTNAHWAAASGYRIGSMYDELWHAVMSSPPPSHLAQEGHEVYRQELAKLLKPLIRHAIRYWELTLMMVERTGVRTDWAEKTRADLERMRTLLLEQATEKAQAGSAPGAPGNAPTVAPKELPSSEPGDAPSTPTGPLRAGPGRGTPGTRGAPPL